jgi:hypothetical protein
MTKKCNIYTRYKCPYCYYVLTEEVVHSALNQRCINCQCVLLKDFIKISDEISWDELDQKFYGRKLKLSKVEHEKISFWKRVKKLFKRGYHENT